MTLSDHAGKDKVVLLFFPAAFTSVCRDEMCQISAGLNDFQALNAAVYGVSGDTPFAQSEWAKQEHITVPLLSDYDHAVARAYDVAYDSFLPEKNLPLSGVAKRSAFVIDKDGVIQYSESSDNPGELPNFDQVKAKLGELA